MSTESKKHIVIFSHGFGTKKDDRGLFAGPQGISEFLAPFHIESVLFDYNEINETENTVTIKALSQQVIVLKNVIDTIKEKYPDAVIDIIAHSQGCLVPASLLPSGIRKVLLTAPSLDVNNQRMVDMFASDPETVIDMKGISRLKRKDGTISIVPSEYWTERENADPISLYNGLSFVSDVTIIKAADDTILGDLSTDRLSSVIKQIRLPGDHGFKGEYRLKLLETIKDSIVMS